MNQYRKLLDNGDKQLHNLELQNRELVDQRQNLKDQNGSYEDILNLTNQIRSNESAMSSIRGNMQGWSDAMRAYAETVGSNLASAIQAAISESMSETGITSATMKQL